MKFYYRHPTQRTNTLTCLKELVGMYREDGYIDEDAHAHVLYKDGSVLSYPDQVEQIRIKNIQNIHFMNDSCSMDFTFDDIVLAENKDFLDEISCWKRWPDMAPKNQLVVDDMEDYYQSYFKSI